MVEFNSLFLMKITLRVLLLK